MPSVIWNLFDFITYTAIVLNFMKLLIFLINIQFEQGEALPKGVAGANEVNLKH